MMSLVPDIIYVINFKCFVFGKGTVGTFIKMYLLFSIIVRCLCLSCSLCTAEITGNGD